MALKFRVKLNQYEQVVGKFGFTTYAVLKDGTEIGTVKIILHNRFGNTWCAWDTTGKEVAQSRTRSGAAAYLDR